jgi:predicted transposase YbfD/YdcC
MAWEIMESPFSWRLHMAMSRRLSSVRIRKFFATLPDPRQRRTRIRYPLLSLIVIAICATVAGANTTEDMAVFARTHRAWLARLVKLPEDEKESPAHDTFDRVLAALDLVAFQKCLLAWLTALHENIQGLIAIDGKVVREAMARAGEQGPLTLVSAWASANHLLLGQVAGVAGSNELEAVPRLLEMLQLEGAIVTLDAMSCQHNIVEQIVGQGGDFVISVKGNQPALEEAVHKTFNKALTEESTAVPTVIKEEHRRRQETRCYMAMAVPSEEPVFAEWDSVKSLVMVVREYTDAKGQQQVGTRYFISSLPPTVKVLANAVRNHWNIENQLHWVLDVTFREDRSRAQDAQPNLGILRRVALSMLKNAADMKGSIDSRRKQAGWHEGTLEKILFGRQFGES